MLLLAGWAYMLWRMLELLQLLMLDVRILGEARRGVVRRRRRCRCWWWNQRRRQFFAQRVQPVEHNRFHESLLKKKNSPNLLEFWTPKDITISLSNVSFELQQQKVVSLRQLVPFFGEA